MLAFDHSVAGKENVQPPVAIKVEDRGRVGYKWTFEACQFRGVGELARAIIGKEGAVMPASIVFDLPAHLGYEQILVAVVVKVQKHRAGAIVRLIHGALYSFFCVGPVGLGDIKEITLVTWYEQVPIPVAIHVSGSSAIEVE